MTSGVVEWIGLEWPSVRGSTSSDKERGEEVEREEELEEEREEEREEEVHGYRLGSQGRFVFSERYVDRLMPQLGLEVVIRRVGSLRSDDQRSVVYVVRRRAVIAS